MFFFAFYNNNNVVQILCIIMLISSILIYNITGQTIPIQTRINQIHTPAAAPGAAGGPPIDNAPGKPLVHPLKGKTTHGCVFTSPDGWVYDLSPLTKPEGVDDYTVNFEKQKFTLTLNMCANVDKMKLPESCKAQSAIHGKPSPVFQTNQPGKSCYYLGDLDKMGWYVMDVAKPQKGVVLTYNGGQPCGGRGQRSVSYHMVCANNFLSSEPPAFAYESPTCHYHVVWPTMHACPRSTTGPRFMHIILSLIIIYFVLRTAYNKFLLGIGGFEAIPHLGKIQSCCNFFLDILDFIKGLIPGINKIGKRRDGNTSSGIEENGGGGGGDEQQNLMNEPMKKMKIGMDDL